MYQPARQLTQWVDKYIILEAGEREAQAVLGYVPPANLEGLQLYLTKPPKCSLSNFSKRLPKFFIASQLTKPIRVQFDRNVKVILVHFYKVRTSYFFESPMTMFTDTEVGLRDIYPQQTQIFHEKLESADSDAQRIRYVDQLLKSILPNVEYQKTMLNYAVSKIFECKGKLMVKDLAEFANTTPKTLETKFKNHLGMTPKKYIDIVRIMHMMQMMSSLKQYCSSTLLEKSNFYDESHLIRSFQRIIDDTPTHIFKKMKEQYWFNLKPFKSMIEGSSI